MSCPHTETTAVLAAFGEAPADFEAHLQACAECQEAVDAHTQTLAVLAPVSPEVDPDRAALEVPVLEVHHTAALTLSFESDLDSDLSDLELELAMLSLE
jgi:hypothetical protein